MTAPTVNSKRPIWSVALRVLIPIAALAAGLLVLSAIPLGDDLWIAGSLALSALVVAISLVLARIDGARPRDLGLTSPAPALRALVVGVLAWALPAAAAFAVLALLGSPLTVTAAPAEFWSVLGLLVVGVLLVEAIPEEVVFRGSVMRVLGERLHGWPVIFVQAALFTATAALLHGGASPADIGLFVAMGIGLGYLRMLTGSVWTTIGFHLAFQTASQLLFAHDTVAFGGSQTAAMVALGAVPFGVGAILLTILVPRHPHWFRDEGAARSSPAVVSSD